MTKKVWLMIAAFLILVGCILLAYVMSKLAKYETNTYEVDKASSDISITTDTADIIFALSEDGKCKVECYEEKTQSTRSPLKMIYLPSGPANPGITISDSASVRQR